MIKSLRLKLFRVMSMSRRPSSRHRQHPFPFSAYILRSYATDNNRLLGQHQEEADTLKQLNQYLNILEINSKLTKDSISSNHSAEMRRTETAIHPSQPPLHLKPPLSRPIQVALTRTHPERPPKTKAKSLSPVKKPKATDSPRLAVALRYQPVSLMALLGRRQDFMGQLRGKELLNIPMKPNQIEDRLLKLQESRGKDRGRVKFNHVTNEQLRSLKYKAKQIHSPTKKEHRERVTYDDESQGQSDECEEKEEVVDMATWKRRNGVGFNQKVFIIKGGYAQLRRGLVDRGWYQNDDVWSPYYDFKWTTRICDINFIGMKHSQGANHFNNNHHLTSKYGLTRRLRTLPLSHGIDPHRFYPRCYDLADQVDFQNFIQNFKTTFSQTIIKRFLTDKARYCNLELKIRITYDILKRRNMSLSGQVNSINKGQFMAITPQQWSIITQTSQKDQESLNKLLKRYRKEQKGEIGDIGPKEEDPEYQEAVFAQLDQKMKGLLEGLGQKDPQCEMNGMRNVWIAKPNWRGIRCFNNLYDIADYCLGGSTQFVVQKYIENPLVVEGRKFDIRQWVVVQDFSPPKIWFYEECYLRFTNEEYSLDNIYNRFVHLTNESLQKHSKKHNKDKSMWTMTEFAQHIGQQNWSRIQMQMKNIIVWSVKACEGHVIGKRGSFQLFGYDFMIDEQLRPWLIEVNMSPSMQYSTPVTRNLVKMVLQDTAKLISAPKKGRHVGNFTCLYKNGDDLTQYDHYKI